MGGYSTPGTVQAALLPQLSLAADGDRRVLKVGAWVAIAADSDLPSGYVTDAGMTQDITAAADLRGPATIATIGTTSDPSGTLTLDPTSGDVFQNQSQSTGN